MTKEIEQKAKDKYPLLGTGESIAMTDEYSGNEIQNIKMVAYIQGYEDCKKEYKNKNNVK